MCQIRGNNAVQQAKMQLFLLHLLTRNLKITVPKTITAGKGKNRQDAKNAKGFQMANNLRLTTRSKKQLSFLSNVFLAPLASWRFCCPGVFASIPSAHFLDKRYAIDLVQRRDSGKHLLQRRFAKTSQPLALSSPANFRTRPALHDHFANVVGKIQQLMNGGAAAVAGVIAGIAADVLKERRVAMLLWMQPDSISSCSLA